ncbi:translocation/assembly module TamB domain-containing protein [Thermovibrio sp.]
MKKKELFKGIVKSLFRGRLHRLLSFLFFLGFIYVAFLVGEELTSYYLTQKEKIRLSVSAPRFSFNLKKGEVDFKFETLKLQLPSLKLYAERGDFKFLPLKSILKSKLIFNRVSVNELSLEINEGKSKRKGQIYSIPIEVRELNIGEILVRYGNSHYIARDIEKRDREIFFGGLIGNLNGKEFKVYPFEGILKDGSFEIPLINLVYGDYTLRASVRGKLERKVYVDFIFSSFCSSCGFFLDGIVKLYGKEISGKGKGKYRNYPIEISFKGTGDWGREEVKVESFNALVGGVKLKGQGRVSLSNVKLKGNFSSRVFPINGLKVFGVKGRFSLWGPLKSLEVLADGSVSKVSSDFLVLDGGEFRVKANRERELYFSYRYKELVKAFFKYSGGNYSGEVKLRNFPSKLFSASEEKWFPRFRLNGLLSFKGRGRKVSYKGEVLPSHFSVFGYSGEIKGRFWGNQREVFVNADFLGSYGKVHLKGKGDITEKSLSLSYSFKDLRLGPLTFLKKLDIDGRVEGKGFLKGNLEALYSEADFKGSGISLKGVELGYVEGRLVYDRDRLNIVAKSSEGIDLQNLSFFNKERLLKVKVSFNGVEAGKLLRISEGFKVNVPVSLKGISSGEFSLEVPLKRLKELSFNLKVKDYIGSVSYGEIFSAERVRGKGELRYSQEKLKGGFEGSFEKGEFKGFKLSQGNAEVLFRGSEIDVNFNSVRLGGDLAGITGKGGIAVNVKEKKLQGNVNLSGSIKSSSFSVGGSVSASLLGSFKKFTVKLSGKLKLNSEYLKEEEKLKVNGSVLEPENVGNIAVQGKSFDLKFLFLGNEERLVGKVRDLKLKFKEGEGEVKLAFVNLEIPSLSGSVMVPTFTVKPYGFYKLYSPTGIYINIEEGKPKISDFSLAYVDGWIEFKNVNFKPIYGDFNGKLGVKGLVYLKELQKVIPYCKGDLALEGEFREKGSGISVSAELLGEGISFKSPYVLEKVEVNSLKVIIEDSSLKGLSAEASVGDGNFVAEGDGKEIKMTLSRVPLGQIGVWKGLISGSLSYTQGELKGNLAVSKAKVSLNKNNGKGESQETKVPLKLNVKVLFEEPLKISSELFWIEILPKLQLTTLNENLIISGNFYITRGEIDYMGKKFKVIYGSGTIEDLTKKKGRISLIASTYISGYYIYMKIEGKLSSPTIYLTSDPPLTKEEIMNLIMTGATPEQIETSSELFPAVQIAYYAVSTVFKPIEEKFQKTLGLESFSLEPYITKYGETVAKLTLVKELSKRVRILGYGTTGQNPEYGGSVDLFLTNSRKYYLELRYNSYYGIEAGIGLSVRIR